MSEVSLLALSKIRLDGGTQSRARLDEDTIENYAEAFKAKQSLPPVVVFFDGTDHWLADGFHRVHGATKAERSKIQAEIHDGTLRDAVLYSVGANATHGLRRSNADKRHAVLMLLKDPEWSKKSDRWVAEKCGVSHPFVALQREALVTVTNAPETRTTKDGREYPTERRAPTTADPRDNDIAEAAAEFEADEREYETAAPSLVEKKCPDCGFVSPPDAVICENCDIPPEGCSWRCGTCKTWYPAAIEDCPACRVDDEAPEEAEGESPPSVPTESDQIAVADLIRLQEQRNANPEYQAIRLAQKAMMKVAPSRAQRMVDFVLDGGELALLLLGLDWAASEQQLNAAYRERSRKAHPDNGGNQAKFVALNQARDLVRTIVAEGSHGV